MRERNAGGLVHLVGGPSTIDTFRALGALDRLGLLIVPVLVGDGMRLTPSLSTGTGFALESEDALPNGVVELVYALSREA